MSETTTPKLGLIKPPVGADQDVWGDRWNTNADTLDANATSDDSRLDALEAAVLALQNAAKPPQEAVGSIKWWPGHLASVPAGWLDCNGQILSTTTYATLFAVLGYLWGGSGSSFHVPDLRGMVLVGIDEGAGRLQGQYPLGPGLAGTGGYAVITLTAAQMPSHAHSGVTDQQGYHAHNYTGLDYRDGGAWVAGSPGTQITRLTQGTDGQGIHQHNITTDPIGGNAGHSNVQPGATGYWIIKAVAS